MATLNCKYISKVKYLFLVIITALTYRNAESTVINITVADFVFTPANVITTVGDTIR